MKRKINILLSTQYQLTKDRAFGRSNLKTNFSPKIKTKRSKPLRWLICFRIGRVGWGWTKSPNDAKTKRQGMNSRHACISQRKIMPHAHDGMIPLAGRRVETHYGIMGWDFGTKTKCEKSFRFFQKPKELLPSRDFTEGVRWSISSCQVLSNSRFTPTSCFLISRMNQSIIFPRSKRR